MKSFQTFLFLCKIFNSIWVQQRLLQRGTSKGSIPFKVGLNRHKSDLSQLPINPQFFSYLCERTENKQNTEQLLMHLLYLWLLATLLFFIIELLTPGFVVACFGVGSLLSAIVAALGGGIVLQIILFCAGSIAALLFLRPLVSRITRKGKETKTGIEALMGRTARVVNPIIGRTTKGLIAIDGDEWPAFAQNQNDSFENGEQVVIAANDSITMFVVKQHIPAKTVLNSSDNTNN